MNIPIIPVLGCIALILAIAALPLMARGPAAKHDPTPPTGVSAWVTVLSTPALLVPTALAATVIMLGKMTSPGGIHPNPFDFAFHDSSWIASAGSVLAMSTLVAGFIGLLSPLRSGRKPGGAHFVAGIRDHTVTIVLGQTAGLWFVHFFTVDLHVEGAMRTTFSTIFLLAPSLALAPLLGTTALHPRRPIRAMVAAFDRISWDLHATARLLCGQVLIIVLIWIVFCGRPGMEHLSVLARESSVLSFQPVFVDATDSHFAILLAAATMITNTVFMLLYHRRVMNVPTRPTRKN